MEGNITVFLSPLVASPAAASTPVNLFHASVTLVRRPTFSPLFQSRSCNKNGTANSLCLPIRFSVSNSDYLTPIYTGLRDLKRINAG
jgi:hypothetical protein